MKARILLKVRAFCFVPDPDNCRNQVIYNLHHCCTFLHLHNEQELSNKFLLKNDTFGLTNIFNTIQTMTYRIITFLSIAILIFAFSCTPKTGEQVTETITEKESIVSATKEINLSPCTNWNQLPNKEDIIEAHVLYKDRLKEIRSEQRKGANARLGKIDTLYNEVIPLWKEAYTLAPAADGKRADHFEDGIRIYEYKYNQAKTKMDKEVAVEKIMELYDKRAECYGEEGYIVGRKGFDYFYKYNEMISDAEKFEMFKKSIDMDGDTANYFILNPMTALLANRVIEDSISIEEGQKYQQKIISALNYGLANCKNKTECAPWKIVEEYVPSRLEQLEGIEGFYDCKYYKEKYLKIFRENSTDCDIINEAISRLKWGGCADTDTALVEMRTVRNKNCKVKAPPKGLLSQARDSLEAARYRAAITLYQEYIDTKADTNEKKARYTLRIASIYYVHLKSFSKARKYAREASRINPNWGDPYLLVGRLYASSGPLCGPGRGWDSQVVVWVAIDEWKKAKRVDPNAAAEANKFINRYSQYMPNVEDIFQRGLKKGDAFKVPCWIQQTTTIRPAP